ncbi:ig-like domain-containing protein, partial [Trichonephila clavata]
MSCIPRESDTREERDTALTYAWTDEQDREVVDARFTKYENGDLEIVNAHISDSGSYKCKQEMSSSTTPQSKNVYEHKLVVYELSGHKFITRVFISMALFSQEIMITMLTDLLATRVCNQELCSPGNIKVVKCQLSETKQEVCEFSIAYEAFGQMAEEQCGEECIRARMYDGLKKFLAFLVITVKLIVLSASYAILDIIKRNTQTRMQQCETGTTTETMGAKNKEEWFSTD